MDAGISKEKRIQEAFKTFENAARKRDDDPEGYEQARFLYFSLKNGPEWAEQEKKRISDKKMNPILNQYRAQFQDLDTEAQTQRGYTDSIAAIRDKQSSLKQGLKGTFDYLRGILDEKKDKISIYDRYVQLTNPTNTRPPLDSNENPNPLIAYLSRFPSSFAMILDVFIAVIILLILILALHKYTAVFSYFRPRHVPHYSELY